MNDDELAELLRRTLRHQADDLQPSSQPRLELVGSPRSRRVRATYVISGLVAAALVAVVASAITLNSNSGRTRLTVDTAAPAHAAPSTLPAPAPKPTVLPTTTTSTIPPLPEYQIPADFSPVSVTFVSSFTGWVLGSVSCETGECAYLARTSNGGESWYGVPVPPGVSLTDPRTGRETGDLVRFANLDAGWIVAPGPDSSRLFATYDGGRDWQSITPPGGASSTIEDLEASAGKVYAAVSAGPDGSDLYTSSVYYSGWTETATIAGGGSGGTSITLQGTSGWILQGGANAGIRLGGAPGTGPGSAGWNPWSGPCVQTPASGVLAASSAQDLSAICESVSQAAGAAAAGTGETPVETLFQSTDQGGTFTATGPLPATQVVAAAQPAGIAATVVAATPGGLVATFDGGQSWQSVYSGGAVGFVGFTTSSQGVAIASGTVLMTFDGGHTWRPLAF